MKFNFLIKSLSILFIVLTLTQCNFLSQNNQNNNKFTNKNNQKNTLTTFAQLSAKKLIKEGWLRISSSNLRDQRRYPAITHDKKSYTVQVMGDNPSDKNHANISQFDDGYFRKNTQWSTKDTSIPAIDALYFRLNGENLYYTENSNDMIVLGAISIKNIIDSKPGQAPGCFEVVDQEQDSWSLCTLQGTSAQDWICAIYEVLGRKCKPLQTVIEKRVIVKQPIIVIPLPSNDCAKDFNYNVHGKNWECRCNEGLEQSPIDLPDPATCLKQVRMNANFDYPLVKKDQVKVVYDRNMVRLVGKTDDVNLGRLTDIDGTIYQVSEIQFHTPADHTFGGHHFDLEVQVIHKAIKGEYKQKAVLSMLYKVTPGATVQFFEEFDILNLPNPMNTDIEDVLKSDFNVMKMMYNDDQYMAPPPFNYYKYRGSFTSPPCEEDVIWFVAAEPIPLGNTIVNFIRDSLDAPKSSNSLDLLKQTGKMADNFDGNNRIIQKLQNREIFFYDRTKGCIPYDEKLNEKKLVGHFEKVEQKVNRYIYVDSSKPSGMPNSFVVSKEEAEGTSAKSKISVNQQRVTDRYNIRQ